MSTVQVFRHQHLTIKKKIVNRIRKFYGVLFDTFTMPRFKSPDTPIEIVLKIRDEYLSTRESMFSICKRYNVSSSSTTKRLRKMGVKIEAGHYKYNENFFKIIDTEEKAYWLGFLYADGNVCISCKGQYSTNITLSIKDIDTVNKFRDTICPKKPIFNRKGYTSKASTKGRKIISGPSACLALTNRAISEDLIKLGCVPRKSLILKFPDDNQVPSSLLCHFIRGYLDGDGCIMSQFMKDGKLKAEIAFESSPDFCQGLKAYLNTMGITGHIRKHKDSRSQSYRVTGNKQINQLLHYLYDDATVSMGRKKDRALLFFQRYSDSLFFGYRTMATFLGRDDAILNQKSVNKD